MFIERQQHPTIEFDPSSGQDEPAISHFFSNQVDPLRTALPLLVGGDDEERVLVISSPLSQLLDETIRLHRSSEFSDMLVVDEQHRPFFHAVRASLQHVLAKIDQVRFAALDNEKEAEGR
jgi:hypothetical protein